MSIFLYLCTLYSTTNHLLTLIPYLKMKALIIGATGATGKDLVTQLLADDTYSEIHSFVRKPMSISHPKLHAHVVDFETPEAWADLVRGDVAFSCLGTTLAVAGSKDAQWQLEDAVKALGFSCLLIFQPSVLIRSNSDRGIENFTIKAFKFLNKLGILKRCRPMPTEILAEKMLSAVYNSPKGTFIFALNKIFSL